MKEKIAVGQEQSREPSYQSEPFERVGQMRACRFSLESPKPVSRMSHDFSESVRAAASSPAPDDISMSDQMSQYTSDQMWTEHSRGPSQRKEVNRGVRTWHQSDLTLDQSQQYNTNNNQVFFYPVAVKYHLKSIELTKNNQHTCSAQIH